MTERLWVLGAADPEMAAIEKLLTDAGEHVAFATLDGVRVHPGNAYRADWFTGEPVDLSQRHAVLVECGFSFHLPGETTWVDHHRYGDPGYGKPPELYAEGASIAQVRGLLYESNTCTRDKLDKSCPEWRLIAAADHCLAAAYRGECPGVDPDELMQWRVRSRAAFQKRPESEVLADVNTAREVLRQAPSVQLGGIVGSTSAGTGCGEGAYGYGTDEWARDMRGQHVSELPEASAREGICFIADGLPDRDGRVKIVCQSGTPDQIKAFMEEWASSQGLVDIYGDPARGFAGGYIQ